MNGNLLCPGTAGMCASIVPPYVAKPRTSLRKTAATRF